MTMPDLWRLASAPTVDLLGWTLLHFVWQGALLAAVLAGILFLMRNHAPRVRYAVSCVALFGLLALPVGTGLFLSNQEAVLGNNPSAPVVAEPSAMPVFHQEAVTDAQGAAPLTWSERAAAWLQPALPWLVWGWGAGVMVFAIRLAGGAWRVRRLRRTSAPAPPEWQERLQALAERMGLRRSVALRRSERVESPVVAGWWRPVVLVPIGLLSGLPPNQVEALLLHELAHVRRHDVILGRLQTVVETLLFFHPATWWISRQVRQTREACCDDCAVRAGTDRTVYARALTALADRAIAGSAAAWTPAANGGALLARIRRLLSPAETSSTHTQRLSMAVAVLLMMGVPLGLAACASQQSTTEADSQQSAETTEVESGESAQTAPSAAAPPSADAERRTIVVIQDDSTKRTVRIESDGPVDVDSLEERALRVQLRADSLHRWHREHADSLRLRLEAMQDSLRPSLKAIQDSLRPRLEAMQDSLRPRLEAMREQIQRERPERLREQARRLREQAERLERRAEEMEAPAPPDPAAPDSVNGG